MKECARVGVGVIESACVWMLTFNRLCMPKAGRLTHAHTHTNTHTRSALKRLKTKKSFSVHRKQVQQVTVQPCHDDDDEDREEENAKKRRNFSFMKVERKKLYKRIRAAYSSISLSLSSSSIRRLSLSNFVLAAVKSISTQYR